MLRARHGFAVGLSIVFIGLFVGSMLLLRVNATLLSPDFINDQLRQADFFTFLYDELAPLAVEEQIQESEDLPFGVQADATAMIASARDIFPPEWLQANVELVVSEVLPYVGGRTDDFAFAIPVKERLLGSTDAIRVLARSSGVYEITASQAFEDKADEALEEFGQLPLGVTLQGEDLAWTAQQIAPPDWLEGQLEGALDEVLAYMTYESDDLSITIPLADRLRGAEPAVKGLLERAEAYDSMANEVARETVEKNIDRVTLLPIGVPIESQEVVDAVRLAVPLEWIQEHVEASLDEFVAYAAGDVDAFAITAPLAERTEIALQELTNLADRKLAEAFAAYPACSVTQAVDIAASLQQGTLPSCQIPAFGLEEVTSALGMPPDAGMTWEGLESAAGFSLAILRDGIAVSAVAEAFNTDVEGLIRDSIGQELPDVYTFTDADLKAFFTPDTAEAFDSFRETVAGGVVIDENFLRRELSGEEFRQLQDFREALRDGISYSSAELREDLAGEDTPALDSLDAARSALNTFDNFKFVAYVVWGILLAGVGFLGGRRWWTRLAWAALPLAIAGLLLFITAGFLYGSLAEPVLDQSLVQLKEGQAPAGFEVILLDKVFDVGKTAAQGFFTGIKPQALIIAFTGFVLFIAAVLWGAVLGPRRQAALGLPNKPRRPQG